MNQTPLRNIKDHLLPLLSPQDERLMSDFELSAVVAPENGNKTLEFDFISDDVLNSKRLGDNDLFIGVYQRLEWKKGKTGDWSNDASGLTEGDAEGIFDAFATLFGGSEHILSNLATNVFQDVEDHQGTIEAGKRNRMLINPFAIAGSGEIIGQITVPTYYGGTFSTETSGSVAAADQVYMKWTFKGIRLRNFKTKFKALVNWSSAVELIEALDR